VNHLLPFDWVPPGVVITNSRGVHAPKAREFAALSALILANRIPEIVGLQRQKIWKPLYSPGIAGRTALVVGVGNMGGAAASACRMLEMRVLGTRRSGEPHPEVHAMYLPDALLSLLGQADIVFVCTPLTPATRHLIGTAEIAAMKSGAGLVNLSRGGVVDAEALRVALLEKRLGGALVDVFDPEPLPAASPLWDTPGLIVTPHCSSDDADTYVPRILDLVFENLRRLIAGSELLCRVDPQRGY
jgi:phosphoglycerate dehydrogenase-like enzyme